MKDVQCYELFGGMALKNHAFLNVAENLFMKIKIKNNFFILQRHMNFQCATDRAILI